MDFVDYQDYSIFNEKSMELHFSVTLFDEIDVNWVGSQRCFEYLVVYCLNALSEVLVSISELYSLFLPLLSKSSDEYSATTRSLSALKYVI